MIWLSENEATYVRRVDEQILELKREWGYLKLGSHWISSRDPGQSHWKPKVFYCIGECKEFIEYWQDKEASFGQRVA